VNPDVGLVRYESDGTLDASFGTQGVVLLDLSAGEWDEAADVVVQPDGKILIAVQAFVGSSFAFMVARFDGAGESDTGFGISGVATVLLSNQNDFTHGVAVQEDGKIVVVGQSSNLAAPDLAALRLNADGTLDTSFGIAGMVTVDFFGGADSGECLVIQTDGKIVVGGVARNGTSNGLGMVRLDP
jgi:uncharacterized delta-60 repeat protein